MHLVPAIQAALYVEGTRERLAAASACKFAWIAAKGARANASKQRLTPSHLLDFGKVCAPDTQRFAAHQFSGPNPQTIVSKPAKIVAAQDR